ncbi:hypothetical protein H5410_035315 [Solanum commersonii]|uniref:Uncharacterized protein n=1 Tax=Solanum commersonii TaxID=4109 RepID=A0A9J5Y0B0_SOLCO|nr:hypothetical protein H5410_035315 [Solanum commersonii]
MDFASVDHNGDASAVEIEELFSKDFAIVHHDVDANDVEVEQRHVNKENVAKIDETSIKDQTMEDSTNVIPTIHHSDFPIEEFVHNKEVQDYDAEDNI